MGNGYGSAGALQDAYGAAFAGGQRFFTWTNDAFNPTAYGVSTRSVPTQIPELVNTASPNTGGSLSGSMSGISAWSLIKSPVPWIVIALLVGIPLYHYWEYERER